MMHVIVCDRMIKSIVCLALWMSFCFTLPHRQEQQQGKQQGSVALPFVAALAAADSTSSSSPKSKITSFNPKEKKKETYSSIKAKLSDEKKQDKEEAFRLPQFVNDMKLGDKNDVPIMLALCNLVYTAATVRRIALQANSWHDFSDSFLQTWDEIKSVDRISVDKLRNATLARVEQHIMEHDMFNTNHNLANLFTVQMFYILNKIFHPQLVETFLATLDAEFDRSELVYAITATIPKRENPKMKNFPSSIAIVFRGSVTLTDWIHNIRFPLQKLRVVISKDGTRAWLTHDNPDNHIFEMDVDLAKQILEGLGSHPIKVHKGFLNYLLYKQRDDQQSKYSKISNQVQKLMMHPSFENRTVMSLTGHSLGGALATLTSFFLACDKNVYDKLRHDRQEYIRVITFASPMVGNIGFHHAMRTLWMQERLKHLRITNDRDIVPMMPPRIPFTGKRYFFPVGVQAHIGPKRWSGWLFGKRNIGRHPHMGVNLHGFQSLEDQKIDNTNLCRGHLWWTLLTTWPFPIVWIPYCLAKSAVHSFFPSSCNLIRALLCKFSILRKYDPYMTTCQTVLQACGQVVWGTALLAQAVAMFRKPLQLLPRFATHGLQDYLDHFHPKMCNSTMVFEEYGDKASKTLKVRDEDKESNTL